MVLVGTLIWAHILSSLVDIASNADPGYIEFRQQLDGINHFISTHEIPEHLGRRLRECMLNQKERVQSRWFEKGIPTLSPALQVELMLHVHASG